MVLTVYSTPHEHIERRVGKRHTHSGNTTIRRLEDHTRFAILFYPGWQTGMRKIYVAFSGNFRG